jgi:hypothetical protein
MSEKVITCLDDDIDVIIWLDGNIYVTIWLDDLVKNGLNRSGLGLWRWAFFCHFI